MTRLSKDQQSAIGRRSRTKGKTFERWCANFFTQWFEGKWQTTRNSGRTDLKGDIYRLDAPDLEIVVECKNNKSYNASGMTKPTEATKQLVRKYRRRQVNLGWSWTLLLVVKNKAGVWVAAMSNCHSLSEVLVRKDVSAIVIEGIYFFKLNQSIAELKHIISKEHSNYTEQVVRNAGAKTKGLGGPDKVGQGE